jgi:hypothetical protein
METFSTNIIFPKESKNENVEIFVRLRGYTKLPDHFIKGRTKSPNPKTINLKSTTRDSTYTETNKKSNSSLKNKTSKTLTESNNSKKKLIFNYLYYMFTTYPKCNKIAITQDGLNGTCIMNNLKTENDLLKINKTILENASIYEYDNCFNEVEDLCDVFFQTIDNKITKLFQGINSSFFIAGPSRSGKSYILFGTIKIKGVIAFSVDKILYYIDYMNNNVNNDNESENNEDNLNNENNEDNLNNENINNKLFLSLVIDQYYLDEKENIFEEYIILEIKDFYSIISNLQQKRRDIAQMKKIQYLENKSNLILTFTIYKINSNEKIIKLLEDSTLDELKENNIIESFSKLSFIELNDSLYGFAPASSPTTLLYRESSKVYYDLNNISINLSKGSNTDIIKSKMMNELYNNVIFKNSHLIILICASPCDPNINVGGNCLIWGYSLRSKINFSKMNNKRFTITNFPSIYVENGKFKDNCLNINSFCFSYHEKKKKSLNKIGNLNIKYNKTFDHFYNSDRNNLKNDDDEKRVETDFNLKDNQKSGKNLISKYKLLQKEIDNIKKQRNIEKKKNNKRFENLEKLILKFKKNNKELKNKENEDNV